jgi:protein-L-isoaspartate(D-aspartate) O-methyltransferase
MGANKTRLLLVVLSGALVLLAALLVWRTALHPSGDVEWATPNPSPTRVVRISPPVTAGQATEYAKEREQMVAYQIKARGVSDEQVLGAMATVPRHEFVPAEYLDRAYSDQPLPIGHGQTISQPYIVALMTELLELREGDTVLEIGTGSGYQAAVLAELGVEVYSMEIIPELAESARQRLDEGGYAEVQTLNADGYYGWQEHAPYDAIIVTAAPDHVPQPLVEQLKDGGRMVIPVGPVGWYQTLWLITKQAGEVEYHNKGGVQFVPLTGEH